MEPWVLVGHFNGHVSIWNYKTQKRMVELVIVEDSLIRSCTFIAREDWAVVGDGHGVIHVRSCKTLELEEVKTFKAHDAWIQTLTIHPSLPLLLTGCLGKLIKLWDWEKGWTCLRTFKGHTDRVEALKFNPAQDDRTTFASASLDCKAKIWDISSILPVATLDCKSDQLTDLDYFLPGGNGRQYIITASISGNARVWDLRTHKCIRVINGTMADGGCCGVRAVYRPLEPPLLIINLEDGSVSLCNSTFRCKNRIDFGLYRARNVVYIEGIRSVVIGFESGLAILEID